MKNILIIGNIAAGKTTLADKLIEAGFADREEYFAIDDLRREYGDGTYAGEFLTWSHMLRAVEFPHPTKNGIYEFSGTGKNAWFVREAIKLSKENANANWRVVYCSCDSNTLKQRAEGRTYDVPIPYKFDNILQSINYIGNQIADKYNTNYWNSPEIVVSTDSKSADECANQIIEMFN